MSKALNISEDLKLPLELAARTQCIFAQKGAGKTYAAGVQSEEMLAAGVQVCILDPTGVWWGLQSSADGKKASPYEIIVMGGGHADVPLEPEAGEIVANFLVETGQSVVLDVSQFESMAAQDRFSLALATKLYRLKAHDKANIHIFLDEADQFCPMKPQKGQERMLHAWDSIVRFGRSRGLGLTAISNRPAAVHTNIRNNIDLLTCLRVTGPHDFKALKEWTGIHASTEQAKEFLELVPSLPDGEAFFWSPSWLQTFKRAKVRHKATFDSSRTPKPGERAVEPKERRSPDLSKLTAQIKASVETAKANDPKELKGQIADLQRQLRAKPAAAAPVEKIKVKVQRVEVQVVKPAAIKRIEQLHAHVLKTVERAESLGKFCGEQVHELVTGAEALLSIAHKAETANRAAMAAGERDPGPPATIVPNRSVARASVIHTPPPTSPPIPAGEARTGGLSKMERAFLTALAQHTEGLSKGQILIHADYRSSGDVSTAFAELLRQQWVETREGKLFITSMGLSVLGPFTPLPTGAKLRAHLLEGDKLSKLEKALLKELFDHHPGALSKGMILERTGYKSSGDVSSAFAKLVRLGWAVNVGRELKASDVFFKG